MKGIRPLYIAIVFIFVIAATCSFADVVKLKNGREITGTVKEINETDVVINMGAGTIWFKRDQVETVNGLSVENAAQAMKTVGAYIMRDKDEAIKSSSQEGLNFISKTRKLEFKSTPEIDITSREKLRENIKKEVEKSIKKDKLDSHAKLLVKLGLIKDSTEYSSKVSDLFTSNVAGYYMPEDKKIYVSDDILKEMLPGMPSMTLMHEQVHALQDQHLDLKKIEDKMENENSDRASAMQSVLEGEATVLMYDAFFKAYAKKDQPAEKGLDMRSFIIDSMLAFSKRVKTEEGKPAIFFEDILFPYVWGGTFIQYTVNNKGWEEVNAIYQDPPVSSEQIMHPEKYYISRDLPQEVVIPDLGVALPGWAKIETEVLGEFGFYLTAKNFLDELSTKLMTEGWGGDAYVLYEEPSSKQLLLISVSKWDTEKDAQEFFTHYKSLILKKYPQASVVKDEPESAQYKNGQENIYITRSKNNILLIEGATDGVLPALIEAIKI